MAPDGLAGLHTRLRRCVLLSRSTLTGTRKQVLFQLRLTRCLLLVLHTDSVVPGGTWGTCPLPAIQLSGIVGTGRHLGAMHQIRGNITRTGRALCVGLLLSAVFRLGRWKSRSCARRSPAATLACWRSPRSRQGLRDSLTQGLKHWSFLQMVWRFLCVQP